MEEQDFVVEEEKETKETTYGMQSSSLLNPNKQDKTQEPQDDKDEMWKCRICFEDLHEPVVTLCGHIYCWTCIYTWYSTKNPSRVI